MQTTVTKLQRKTLTQHKIIIPKITFILLNFNRTLIFITKAILGKLCPVLTRVS